MKVLFVCTGNICRSPMAEGLLRHRLAQKGCDSIEVASAGTWASFDVPAMELACDAVAARGASISDHRSRPLSPEELAEADLVVAMTSVHLREIEAISPEAAGKTLLIKALAEMDVSPDHRSSRDAVKALLAAPRPRWRRAMDVDDPIGLPITAYERCARELEEGVGILAEILCGGERRENSSPGAPPP